MPKSAIVVVVDRLGCGCLGPYGCTWVDTPNLNAIAARSLLIENMLVDSPELPSAYRAYFTGRHVLESDDGRDVGSAVRTIAEASAATTLVTDDVGVAELPAAGAFAERLLLSADAPTSSAKAIEDTALAKLFAAAIDQLHAQQDPFLLWVHAQGMNAPWDAPLAMRQALADEEDPDPLTAVDVPSLNLEAAFDPDDLLGIVQAYAAQVMLLDACLGVLADAIDGHPLRNDLLTIVTSPRGFPLGEHGIVGGVETALHEELLHVPCLLWRGDGQSALRRSHQLSQPPDIAATLLNWFDASGESNGSYSSSLLQTADYRDALPHRQRALSIAGEQKSLRTPAWFFRQMPWDESHPPGEVPCQLYRKPDDRWEVNEVSRRCPQIVEQLADDLEQYETALRSGDAASLAPLAEELVEGIE